MLKGARDNKIALKRLTSRTSRSSLSHYARFTMPSLIGALLQTRNQHLEACRQYTRMMHAQLIGVAIVKHWYLIKIALYVYILLLRDKNTWSHIKGPISNFMHYTLLYNGYIIYIINFPGSNASLDSAIFSKVVDEHVHYITIKPPRAVIYARLIMSLAYTAELPFPSVCEHGKIPPIDTRYPVIQGVRDVGVSIA